MEMDPRLRTWRYRVFAATWLSYACFYFCRKPFYISKAALGEEFHLDATMLGLVGTSYLVAYTLGQFIAGWAGNRWGPRLLLLVGMATSAACGIGFGLSNSFATFSLLMFLNGLAQATGWSGNVGSMAAWFHRQERGTVMGLWATNFQVGGVAATSFASFALGAWGYRWAFISGSAVLLAAWLFFLFNQRNRPEDVGLLPVTSPHDLDDPLGRPVTEEARIPTEGWSRDVKINVLIVGTFYFFVKFIRYALWSWAPYMLKTSYGMAADDAGFLSVVFDAAGILGVIVAGLLSDRLFKGRRAQISFYFICAMALSCLLLFFLGPKSLVLFGVSMGLVGFALYGPDALMTGAGAIDVGSKKQAALAAGIINGMGSVGAVVQELLLGGLLDTGGVAAVFGMLLGSAVLAAACLSLLLLRNRTGRADV